MRFWLASDDGKTYGPYEVEQLRQFAAEGRLTAQSQVCAEGSTHWVPAGAIVPGIAAPQQTPQQLPVHAQGVGGQVAPGSWQPVNFAGPILVTLCCCLVGGIISIVYASQANTHGAGGNIVEAQRAAAASKMWMWISFAVGIVISLIYFVGGFLGALPQ